MGLGGLNNSRRKTPQKKKGISPRAHPSVLRHRLSFPLRSRDCTGHPPASCSRPKASKAPFWTGARPIPCHLPQDHSSKPHNTPGRHPPLRAARLRQDTHGACARQGVRLLLYQRQAVHFYGQVVRREPEAGAWLLSFFPSFFKLTPVSPFSYPEHKLAFITRPPTGRRLRPSFPWPRSCSPPSSSLTSSTRSSGSAARQTTRRRPSSKRSS